MEIFNLKDMKAMPYEQRDKNVFYEAPQFKTRIIQLPPGGRMPECDMETFVIFIVVEGSAKIKVNQKEMFLIANECLITEPAVLSMTTESGVKIMGVQIKQ